MESWLDLTRGASQSVVEKDKIREVQKCQLTADLELQAKSLDLIQQEQLILEQEGDVIKMAFAKIILAIYKGIIVAKGGWNQDHQERSDCNPCVNRTGLRLQKKGENDDYIRHYKGRGFRGWFLNHQFQNHLAYLLKIHIPVLHAKTL